MKTLALLLAACLLLVGTAYAQKVEPLEQVEITDGLVRDNCDVYGYDDYQSNPGGLVPDDNPGGVFFGPVPTVDNGTILDVILAVNISHTWIGDLRIFLYYDVTCDGSLDAQGEVLCRLGFDGCLPDGCCGCGGDLNGWYGFDDVGATSIEDICPSVFPTGCYGPDYDSSGLGIFDGLPSGGCFWLWVADGAVGDEGEVFEWDVYVLTESAEPVVGAFDIKPTSCPNPLNVKSRGVMPAAILGTEDFDVMEIDPESIMLACTVQPLRWSYEDVATPVGPDAELCDCTEEGPDGFLDLTMKFATQDVVAAIAPFDDGDEISVMVSATLWDGTVVVFDDCVWIIDKTREPTRAGLEAPDISDALKELTEPTTWGTIKALYR
jgi:hypothetical protein